MSMRSRFQIYAFIAAGVWVACGISAVIQKTNADSRIKDAYDISAIQIQQLNGSVTSHILMLLVLGFAGTVPLLIVTCNSVMSRFADETYKADHVLTAQGDGSEPARA